MIQINDIELIYKKNNELIKCLNKINLKLPNKGLIFLLGKSGSGKTSLLNIISGYLKPTKGNIFYNRVNYLNMSNKQKTAFYSNVVSFVFQDNNLFQNKTVEKNISLAVSSNIKFDKQILESLYLKDFENRVVGDLSGGEKKRVSIARAINRKTKVVLIDEPTDSLDPKGTEEVFNFLKKEAENKLIIVSTHNKKQALKYSNQIIELSKGEVILNTIEEENNIEENNYLQKKSKKKFKNLLPFSFAFLIEKPIKSFINYLIIVIFLFILSFLLMLIFYSPIHSASKYLSNSPNKYINLNKNIIASGKKHKANFSNDEFEKINEKYFSQSIPVYNTYKMKNEIMIKGRKLEILGIVEIDNQELLSKKYNVSIGRLPNKNILDNEISITETIFHFFKLSRYFDEELNDYSSIINKKIKLIDNNDIIKEFEIVGVLNTGFDYKNEIESLELNINNFFDLKNKYFNSIENCIYFRKNFHKERFQEKHFNNNHDFLNKHFSSYINFSFLNEISKNDIIYYENKVIKNLTKLNSDDFVINIYVKDLEFTINNLIKQKAINYASTLEDFTKIKNELSLLIGKEATIDDYVEYILNNEINKFSPENSKKEFRNLVVEEIILSSNKYNKVYFNYKENNVVDEREFFPNGFILTEDKEKENLVFVSDDVLFEFINYEPSLYGFISTIFVSGDDNYNNNYNLLKFNIKNDFLTKNQPYQFDEIEVKTNYIIYNYSLVAFNNLKTIKLILIPVNILLLILLIFYNLFYFKDIFNSKKYEIGLLKSFGYNVKNLSMITFIQSLLISFISFITLVVLIYVTTPYFNNYFKNKMIIDFDIMESNVSLIFIIISTCLISLLGFIYTFVKISRKDIKQLIIKD